MATSHKPCDKLGAHVNITDICIAFENNFKPPSTLEAFVGPLKVKAVLQQEQRDGTFNWVFQPSIDVFQADSFVIHRPRPRFLSRLPIASSAVATFSGEHLIYECLQQSGHQCVSMPPRQQFNGCIKLGASLRAADSKISDTAISSALHSTQDLSVSPNDILTVLDQIDSVYKPLGRMDSTNALEALVKASLGFSKMHPIAYALIMTLAIPYKLWQNEQQQVDDLHAVTDTVRALLSCLTDVRHAKSRRYMKVAVAEIVKLVLEANSLVDNILGRNRAGEVTDSQIRSNLNEYRNRLSRLQDKFDHAVRAQTASRLNQLAQNRDHAALYKCLSPSKQEELDALCLPGTRWEILGEVDDWLCDLNRKNILWITGKPGSGKTALSSSISASHEIRCASFFFKRDVAELRDPRRVWRTIAFGLSERNLLPTSKLLELSKRLMAHTGAANISGQFTDLVHNLLPKSYPGLSYSCPFVMIDALDECDSSSSPDDWKGLLRTLKLWATLPSHFKLIVTSPEHAEIHRTLEEVSEKIELHTGDQVDDAASRDISLYFTHRFEKLSRPRELANWPVTDLTQMSSGSFVWAKVVMDFIQDGDHGERLSLISRRLGKGGQTVELLYGLVLDQAFQDCSPKELRRFKAILAAVVLAYGPLSCKDVKEIMDLSDSEEAIEESIGQLKAVIYINSLDKSLRVCHTSFVDFMADPRLSMEARKIHEHAPNCYEAFALGCLHILNSKLGFNICRLGTSYLPHHAMLGKSSLEQYIPSYLQYASLNWSSHLVEIVKGDVIHLALLQQSEVFLHQHFLHWLEVIGLIGATHVAPQILLLASTAFKVWSRSIAIGTWHAERIEKDLEKAKNLTLLAEDAAIFCVTFQEVISHSIPHIYLSALPFSPKTSAVYQHYRQQFNNTLMVIEGQNYIWPKSCHILTGHESQVNQAAFSPDGHYIVSCSSDKTIRVWDAKTGMSNMDPIHGHQGSVNSVAFSPDGHHIVSCSDDKTIRLWDAKTGKSIMDPILGHQGWVKSVAFSPDGQHIVSCSCDLTIRVWDAKTGKITLDPIQGHQGWINSVAFSPDSQLIASCSDDKTIRVWDAKMGRSIINPIYGHTGWVKSIAFSPDSIHIVSCSWDNTIKVWDARTGKSTMNIIKGHQNAVTSVAFSSDNKYIVSCSWDRTIRLWNAKTGKSAMNPIQCNEHSMSSVTLSPDGQSIVSCSTDKTIRVWKIKMDTNIMDPVQGHESWVNSVAFSPNSQHIVSCSWDKTIRVWDKKTCKSTIDPIFGHQGSIVSVSFSPDSKYIVSCSRDKTVRLWNAKTGKSSVDPILGHEDSVNSVAFSSDSQHIISCSDDMTIRVWDVKTGKSTMEPIQGHQGWVNSVAFSPNNQLIASCSDDKTIRVWNAITGKSIMNPIQGHQGWVKSVAFSPNSQHIVSCSIDKTIRVWDVITGESIIDPIQGHESCINSVAFSPDGNCIVSCSDDKTIRVWDAKTGKSIMNPIQGHRTRVTSVAFSPDSQHIVSCSHDKTIRIWDTKLIQSIMDPAKVECITKILPSTNFLTEPTHPELSRTSSYTFFDNRNSIIWDHTAFIDDNGWLCLPSHTAYSRYMFWVPPECRHGLCWPGTTGIIGAQPIRLDFGKYEHGTKWEQCKTSAYHK